MAKSHYSADSAHFPPFSLMLQLWSDVTGADDRALVPDIGITADGKSFPITNSSIG
jgi:hypothetical protein